MICTIGRQGWHRSLPLNGHPGAALWDMSLLAATDAAAPHLALQLMAAWQATFAVIVMLVLTPAAIARLPVRSTAEM